jgi:hypothetical protein
MVRVPVCPASDGNRFWKVMRIFGTSRTQTVPAAPNVNASGSVVVDVVDEVAGSVEDVDVVTLGADVDVVDAGDEVVVVGSTDDDVVGPDDGTDVLDVLVVGTLEVVVVDGGTSVVVVVGATTVLITTVVVVVGTVVGPHSLSR